MSNLSDKSTINSAPSSPGHDNPHGVDQIMSTNHAAAPLDTSTLLPIDQYRLQLYNYAIQAERLRLSQQYGAPYNGNFNNGARVMSYFHPRFQINSEEPKPQHSYIGLIAMAILSSPEMKLVLSDIYQYILDNYSYFRTRGPGWRNSIRHNLSLNDCFIKAGRSANGKGHYWSIHPANVDDFKKGDFRRRKAQRKVRKHMGLSVDDDNDSNSPPPLSPPLNFTNLFFPTNQAFTYFPQMLPPAAVLGASATTTCVSRKRLFDVDSLLAPDQPSNPLEDSKKSRLQFESSDNDSKCRLLEESIEPYDTRPNSAERVKKSASDEEDEILEDDDAENEADIDVVNNNNGNEGDKLQESLILQRYYQTLALRRIQMYQHFQQSNLEASHHQ